MHDKGKTLRAKVDKKVLRLIKRFEVGRYRVIIKVLKSNHDGKMQSLPFCYSSQSENNANKFFSLFYFTNIKSKKKFQGLQKTEK